MKRIAALSILLAMLLAFAACGAKKNTEYDKEGYMTIFEIASELPRDHSREKLDRIFPSTGTDYLISTYAEHDRDYMEEINAQYDYMHEQYVEKYGADYKIKCEVVEAVEKDEEGIKQYLNFDNHYFEVYGVDKNKVAAVTFVTVRITIEGSLDSFEREKTLQCYCVDGNWYSFYSTQLPLKLG